ncbi:hypothetical protein BC008_18305 [Mastigocoleus testarum BC008]|uniref:C-type lectin domain-containing protein n=2 Tax=Mastigocoleus TaxID=996924 RepID=A0A0V7ZG29_9CYAN|nr:hypothetical protein BC008_13365 [Mastigocoleus testarum BC008]KST64580.1 hypothetical protein BC008_18305 [Mastigocoleus testarum BC008]
MNVSLEQMIGYEMTSLLWGQLFADDIEINIFAKCTDQLDANIIGGAVPEYHEQHYALFLEYFAADITSEEDQLAYDALQQGNTVDFLLNGDLIGGNTKIKLTTALAQALGMNEAISLDRYVLDDSIHFLDGTIMMNQDFSWDFNYLRDSEAAENTLDFLSVALHETGHILGFTSSLDFSLQQDTLYSGRTELTNFSPLDLFRFSAQSLAQNNPDGSVSDLSIGGVAWFSPDGGETLTAKMSTGKEGDGYQASHWERRYDPLGIMDPTLWYQERASITDLDVLAFDVMGYDLSESAGDVEQLFTTQGLELTLAQAKIQLAEKLGVSVEWIEENANVPVSSLDLIAQIEAEIAAAASESTTTTETTSESNTTDSTSESTTTETTSESNTTDSTSESTTTETTSESNTTDSTSESTTTETTSESTTTDNTTNEDEPDKDFFKDLRKMKKKSYKWWAQDNEGGNSSWQEFYEWWSQNNEGGNSSWQEHYEWWAQNNGGGNSSWQELYEWWSQNNEGGNSSWQELYEWWSQDNEGGNSWWQEVFFASQDNGNFTDIRLPGQNNSEITNVIYGDITGGHEDDIIGGDTSNDNIVSGKGDDLVDGAEGDDTIIGGEGYDTIFGFDGNDSIKGGKGDDLISGESGEDVLLGEAGADVLMGGEHDDYLDGGEGRDFLNGDTGHDALIGGKGNDALEGGAGKDLLVGGEGKDIGNGGSGDDFIFGDRYSAILQKAFGNNLTPLIGLFTPETDTTTEEVITVELAQDPMRIEAENMTLSGNYNLASSGTLVQTNSTANISTIFNGQAGLYNIVIGYHDVYGNARITASLGSSTIDDWYLNQTSGSTSPGVSNFKTRTIASEVSLNGGESLFLNTVAYAASSGGDDDDDGGSVVYDKAYIDYVDFVPIVNNNNVTLEKDPVRLEAEEMNWTGVYKEESKTYASGGKLIGPNSDNQWIYGNTTFNLESGLYNVIVGYHDIGKVGESKYNQGRIKVKVNGVEIDNWKLDDVLYDSQLEAGNFTKRTINNVQLSQGDTFGIDSLADFTPEGFIDYIEFVPVEVSTDTSDITGNSNTTDTPNTNDTSNTTSNATDTTATAIELGANSDILRGGNGNDGIDGGEGNDIIFGEDEANDSSNIAPINIAGSFNYGRSTYILSQAGTWTEAQAEAESYGGNLVTINDAAENQWLKDTFGTTEALFIGFSDAETEGTWKWASGQVVDWVLGNTNDGIYTDWAPNQPDDSQGNQDYAILSHIWDPNTNKWDDVTTNASFRGIIEIDWSSAGGNDTIVGGSGDDQIYGNSGNDSIYGDDIDDGIAVKTPQTLTFQQGVNGYNGTVDTQLNGYYWTTSYSNATSLNIDSNDLGYPIHSLIRFEDIFGAQEGQIALDGTINSAFLELDVSDPGSSFKVHEMLKSWSDNVTWYSWDTYDNGVSANGVEASNTAVATTGSVSAGILRIDVTESLKSWQTDPTSNYGWAFLPTGSDGVDFDSAEGAKAPRLVVDVEQVSSSTSGIDGAVYNGSKYIVTDTAMTWNVAQAYAESIGGNLVTINDASEEEWLKTTFGSTEELWIGLTDKNVEGQFEWSSGEALTYTNWVPGEPNNVNGGDYVRMNYQNQWGDKKNIPLRGIIEIKLSTANGSNNIDAGNDHITGNGGNDTISGGAGNDVINGTDEVVAGYYEKDILTGVDGADKFILGDANQAYYATAGHQDYALIKDFDSTVDFLQLHGVAEDYQQQQQGDNIFLSRDGDLVAILEDNITLNLSDSAFEYV